jgi:hypothetical protein
MKTCLLVLALVLGFDDQAKSGVVDVAPDGITELESGFCHGSTNSIPCARPNRSYATAKIRTLKLEPGAENGGERNRGFHCSGGRIPCSPVIEIELKLDGIEVGVPASVYADLADVNRAQLRQMDDGVALFLNCGDASGSYSVRIDFDAKGVRKRTMVDGFDESEVVEETTYHQYEVVDR